MVRESILGYLKENKKNITKKLTFRHFFAEPKYKKKVKQYKRKWENIL